MKEKKKKYRPYRHLDFRTTKDYHCLYSNINRTKSNA